MRTIGRTRPHIARLAAGALLGALGVALVTATPAAATHSVPGAAPDNCGQPNWTIGVTFLGLQSAQNLTLQQQLDSSYAGTFGVRVRCTDASGQDIGVVPHTKIAIWTTVPDTTVNGIPATNSAHPALLTVPDGTATLTIRSTAALLGVNDWFGLVGQNTLFITAAFDQGVTPGTSPIIIGNIWARTPELSSLALFGVGALALAAYVLVRRRAARRA